MTEDRSWWLLGNSNFGVSVHQGAKAVDARVAYRAAIAQAYEGEGLSPSACTRAAYSYHVFVIAGGLTYEQAWAARDAWEANDCQPAEELGRAWRSRHRRKAADKGEDGAAATATPSSYSPFPSSDTNHQGKPAVERSLENE